MLGFELSCLVKSQYHIEQTKKLWSEPLIIDNFLNSEEMLRITQFAHTLQPKEILGKSGYHLTVRYFLEESMPLFLRNKINEYLKGLFFRVCFFHDASYPFEIHCDSGLNDNSIPYKAMIYSFKEATDEESLILYDHYGLYSSSINYKNFRKFDKDLFEEDVGYKCFDPEEFKRSDHSVFFDKAPSLETPFEYLSHIDQRLLQHFRVTHRIPYKFNRLIIFDSCQLHSGGVLERTGKLGEAKRLTLFSDCNI